MTDLPVSNTENENQFLDQQPPRRQEQSLYSDRPRTEAIRTDGGTGIDSALEDEQERPLFPSQQCTALRDEWQSIQADFVDSPRASVEKADVLVKKTIDTLSGSFSEMRNSLENTWEKDREVSTEDLRLAFQNYRSFFQRLLSL